MIVYPQVYSTKIMIGGLVLVGWGFFVDFLIFADLFQNLKLQYYKIYAELDLGDFALNLYTQADLTKTW